MEQGRKYIDCRKYPTEKPCTLAIHGNENDVLDAAAEHAVSKHGHRDSPELRSQLRTMLQDEA